MILMVDLRNLYLDFIHGFLVKQIFIISLIVLVVKRECPLKPSHIESTWHMMKNQNFSYSSQRYPRVSLEAWCDFFLEIFF